MSLYDIFTACKHFGRICRVHKESLEATCITIKFIQSPATEELKTKSTIAVNNDELAVTWLRDYDDQASDDEISFETFSNFKPSAYDKIELWRMEEYFKEFGHSFTELDLSCLHFAQSDIIIQLMLLHCPELQELKCNIYDPQTVLAMRPLIGQLKSLTISVDDIHSLFDSSQPLQLESLHLRRVPIPRITFPKLVTIHVEHSKTLLQSAIERFFTLNPHIQNLTINDHYRFGIEHIIKHLPELHELTLIEPHKNQLRWNDYTCLYKCNELRTIRIRGSQNPDQQEPIVGPLLEGLFYHHKYIIECLEIEGRIDLRALSVLCNLNNIERLRVDYLNGDQLQMLTERLEKITEITVNQARLEFHDIRSALNTWAELRRARFVLNNGVFGVLPAINGKIFNDIATMTSNRNIDLQVEYDMKRLELDDIPVAHVSESNSFSYSSL